MLYRARMNHPNYVFSRALCFFDHDIIVFVYLSQQSSLFNTDDDRDDAFNIALVFTDGNSNVNQDLTIPNAIEARVEGTHVIVFGVGEYNMLELEGIASWPYDQTIHVVKSWRELATISEPLKQATCDGTYD